MRDVFIYDAVRSPRGKGKNSGALYEIKPIKLLVTVLKALEERNALKTELIDDLVIGCVTPIDEQGANIAKAAALNAGWSYTVPAFQLNRFCASGLEAVNLAAMKIRSGWEDIVVAGGLESMSRVPMGSDGGAMLYDPEVINDLGYIPQGVSADLIASVEGFTRIDLDNYAVQSQKRAAEAIENGYFDKAIIPVHDMNGLPILEKDEHPRPDTTEKELAKLSPSFAAVGELGFDQIALAKYPQIDRIHHLHTAGNSSGIVDGAALVLLGSKEAGEAQGLNARAKVLSVAAVGSEPTIMLQGPTPAVAKALEKAGLSKEDVDLWEMNEAFSAPVLKFRRDFDIPADKLNVNGGAIALGHPLGATGAMILGTLLDELERRELTIGVATLCVGGGMGVATVIERIK